MRFRIVKTNLVYLSILSALLILLALGPSVRAALPTAGSTLFFDDFLNSGFPNQWNPFNAKADLGNVTQQGGYLVMSGSRFSTTPGFPDAVRLIANASGQPTVDVNTPNGQFIFMAWKIAPFNLTSGGGPQGFRLAELDFGLRESNYNNLGGPWNQIIFKVASADAVLQQSPGASGKSVVYVSICSVGATTCFDSRVGIFTPDITGIQQNAVQYTPLVSPFDLNAIHIFTMEMRLYQATSSLVKQSWVAFQVDNNAWLNMTQGACSCIDASGGPPPPFHSLYPQITLGYTLGCPCTPPSNPLANQSVGASIDWVLVDDYVPASLPAGQILVSSARPPPVLPQPGVTGSLVDFMQFEANSVSPGNIFAGGMIIMGIVSGLMFIIMGMIARKMGLSFVSMGFFYSIFVEAFAFFGLITSILPFWIPVMSTIIMIALTFGVIKGSQPGRGGFVPE